MSEKPRSTNFEEISDNARRTLEPYLPGGKRSLEALTIEELEALDEVTKPGTSFSNCFNGNTRPLHDSFQLRISALIEARKHALSLLGGMTDEPEELAQMVDPDSGT